jgi:cell wall-associated NlpC family hydrolase
MTDRWIRTAAALALAGAGCAAGHLQARRPLPPPPAGNRAGASEAGGAGPAPALPRKPSGPPGREARLAVEAASALVGRRAVVVDGVDYGPGCTALVRASLQRAGLPLPPEVRDAGQLHTLAERSGALRAGRRLQPGDVVFLADRPGGPPAHAGLVARTDPDGTAVVLHRVARGVMRLRLNLAWPQQTNDPTTGRLVNDTLAVGREPRPAGSLVVGVADLLGAVPSPAG